MSYTTIIHIYPDDRIEHGMELHNSWGGAMAIWTAMKERYLPWASYSIFMGESAQQLWDLWKDERLPIHHRAVMMMTFDTAYVPKTRYQQAAQDIRHFLLDFPEMAGKANHWPIIAKMYKRDPDVPAIGIWHTSVSENPFDGHWNEEREEYDPPDWSELYDIYKELEKLIPVPVVAEAATG